MTKTKILYEVECLAIEADEEGLESIRAVFALLRQRHLLQAGTKVKARSLPSTEQSHFSETFIQVETGIVREGNRFWPGLPGRLSWWTTGLATEGAKMALDNSSKRSPSSSLAFTALAWFTNWALEPGADALMREE